MLTSALQPVNRAVRKTLLVVVNNGRRVIPSARRLREDPAMGSEKNLVVIEGVTTESTRLTRREMVQRFLAAMSAGAAWPVVAGSHPVFGLLRNHLLLRNNGVLDRAEELGQANWKPAFLTLQENELLTALAESIVPESRRAHASRFIDLLLSVDTPDNQRKFRESLAAMDAAAQSQFKSSFPALEEEQKNEFLTDASTKSKNPQASETEAEKKRAALYSHFGNLKGWISGAYYSSELGMRELGWTGDYAFAAFPGCAHPEGHH